MFQSKICLSCASFSKT